LEVCETIATVGTEQTAATLPQTNGNTTAEAGRALAPQSSLTGERTQSILARWVAADPRSKQLLEQAQKVAPASSTILIRGESGVGKNLLASIVHALSRNSDAPLVRIECAGLPADLVECELFGEEAGANAGEPRRGRLETAGKGTVVLDEVAAFPMSMQAKLLRVIEEKRFQRPGSSRFIEISARIVALTSIDLERAVTRRTFREDLYYRLNVVPLLIPPLRERPADIRPLAEYLAAQLSELHRKPHLSVPGAVMLLALVPDSGASLVTKCFAR